MRLLDIVKPLDAMLASLRFDTDASARSSARETAMAVLSRRSG